MIALAISFFIGLVGYLASIQIGRKANSAGLTEHPSITNWRSAVVAMLLALISNSTVHILQLNNQQESITLLTSPSNTQIFAENARLEDQLEDSHLFLRRLHESRISAFEDQVQTASEGRMNVGAHEVGRIAREVVDSATVSIVATSYVEDSQWWGTSWGRAYINDNREAVGRGVRISRTFIFDSVEEMEAGAEIMRTNSEAGVQVYWALASEIGRTLSRDVVLVDDQFAGVLLLDGRNMDGVYFTSDRDELAEIRDTLGVISQNARLYEAPR